SQRPAALHSAGPILLPSAEKVANDEFPSQPLEGLISSFLGPVRDMNFVCGRCDDIPRLGGIGALIPHDSARRLHSTKTVVPVHKVVSPHPGLDALFLKVVEDLQDVLGIKLTRIFPPASRTEGTGAPLVVPYGNPLGMDNVNVLVHDIEQQFVGVGI